MILSATNPAQVIARTNEPILVPETSDEIDGVVPNVVFPTASELIGGERYVFYGMADTKIGVARLDRTNAADNSIEHNGTGGDRSEQTA
jgi:predicted GH43/DUF377 family glycosyl hydrolase